MRQWIAYPGRFGDHLEQRVSALNFLGGAWEDDNSFVYLDTWGSGNRYLDWSIYVCKLLRIAPYPPLFLQFMWLPISIIMTLHSLLHLLFFLWIRHSCGIRLGHHLVLYLGLSLSLELPLEWKVASLLLGGGLTRWRTGSGDLRLSWSLCNKDREHFTREASCEQLEVWLEGSRLPQWTWHCWLPVDTPLRA